MRSGGARWSRIRSPKSSPTDPMDCWHCKRSAVGVCRFCGRGICEDHVETQPYILQLFRAKDVPQVLVVEDALYCGACTPRPDPVELPELDSM